MNDLDKARVVKNAKKKMVNIKALIIDLQTNLNTEDDHTLKIVITTVEMLDNYVNNILPYALPKELIKVHGVVDERT